MVRWEWNAIARWRLARGAPAPGGAAAPTPAAGSWKRTVGGIDSDANLRLDQETSRATNLSIPWSGLPIFAFGSDEAGEAYVLTSSPTGQGVFRLVPPPQAAATR